MECTAGVIFGSSISMLSGSLLLLLDVVVDLLELVEGGVVEVLERGVLEEADGGVFFLVDVLLAAGLLLLEWAVALGGDLSDAVAVAFDAAAGLDAATASLSFADTDETSLTPAS